MRQGRDVVANRYMLVCKHSHVTSKLSHSASSECVGREQTPMRRRLNLPPSTVSVSIQPQDARGLAALAIRATVAPSTKGHRVLWKTEDRHGCSDHGLVSMLVTRIRDSPSFDFEVCSLQAWVSRVSCVFGAYLATRAYFIGTRLWLMIYCEEE